MPSPSSLRPVHSSHNNHNHLHQHPRPSHHRERSKSDPAQKDPFRDPDYVAPRLDYDRDVPGSTRPTQPARRTNRHHPPDAHRDNMLAAVRDTVTADKSLRQKVERSKTGDITTSRTSAKLTTPRRSYSQDSSEKSRKPKKNSSHADVIDRLDFTGVGPMFHHDGPFDACAPSRNRHKTKAPMFAWTATTAAEDERALSASRHRAVDRRLHSVSNMTNTPDSERRKKKVDPIAEAWGIHEPEPYEEFFGGGGGGGGSGNVSAASSIRVSIENANFRHRAQESKEQEKPLPSTRKPRSLPPPQPLRLPGEESVSPPLASPTSDTPKRSKSLMQRIRKMRDAPNVPADAISAGDDPSPPSSVENYNATSQPEGAARLTRPTHRHQNSFFGRFARTNAGQVSPTDEQYVYSVDNSKNKALPARPLEQPVTLPSSPQNGEYEGSGGAGIGRKSSLLKKVKGVVRGGA